MISGIFVVGNIVYYVHNEILLGYATVKELGDTTQTTITVYKWGK